MKTLVFTIFEQAEGVETDAFWTTCIDSIETWATGREYDFQIYGLSDEPYELLHACGLIRAGAESYSHAHWTRLCLDRFIRLNQPSYDRILWVDPDVIVRGNPQLSEENGFYIKVGKRRAAGYPYPLGGFWYCVGGCHLDLYARFQACLRGQISQELRWFLNCVRSSHSRTLSDQEFLQDWIHNHGYHEVGDLHYEIANTLSGDWTKIYSHPNNFTFGPPPDDAFVHFGGPHKAQRLQWYLEDQA